jgi:uncharacterized lipoprotein YehR (DUF1307 family)
MANKRFRLGILVLALVFSLFLTGCGDIDDDGDYTFEFKVADGCDGYWEQTITKIEFINGSNDSAPVLQTETVNLGSSERSRAYKVSGFTEKDGNNLRSFSVNVTIEYKGVRTLFLRGSAKNNSKISVGACAVNGIGWGYGDW